MSTEVEALEAAAGPRPRLREDLAALVFGSMLALILLWYIHGKWQPNWALVCGAVGGIITRRWVRPSGRAVFCGSGPTSGGHHEWLTP